MLDKIRSSSTQQRIEEKIAKIQEKSQLIDSILNDGKIEANK